MKNLATEICGAWNADDDATVATSHCGLRYKTSLQLQTMLKPILPDEKVFLTFSPMHVTIFTTIHHCEGF